MAKNKFLEEQHEQIDIIYGIIEEGTEGTFTTKKDLDADLKNISDNAKKAFENAVITSEELSALEKEIEKCHSYLNELNTDKTHELETNEDFDKVKKLLKKNIWLKNVKTALILTLVYIFFMLCIISEFVSGISKDDLVISVLGTAIAGISGFVIIFSLWKEIVELLKIVKSEQFTCKKVKALRSKKMVYEIVKYEGNSPSSYSYAKVMAKGYSVQDMNGKKLGYYFNYRRKKKIPINSDKIDIYLITMKIDDKTEKFLIK